MIRVHIICEGQTEEMFVNEVLSDAFNPLHIALIPALIGRPGHKGGNFKFERLLIDIKARLLKDKTAYCTTFFDFYGLPESFPGKKSAAGQTTPQDKAQHLQDALLKKLGDAIPSSALRRFIPYVQMHEFEGLLFSNPEALAISLGNAKLVTPFQQITSAYASPEAINNHPQTAPSKRIEALYPGYEKPINGSLAALDIGLTTMRKQCALFDGWLTTLQELT